MFRLYLVNFRKISTQRNSHSDVHLKKNSFVSVCPWRQLNLAETRSRIHHRITKLYSAVTVQMVGITVKKWGSSLASETRGTHNGAAEDSKCYEIHAVSIGTQLLTLRWLAVPWSLGSSSLQRGPKRSVSLLNNFCSELTPRNAILHRQLNTTAAQHFFLPAGQDGRNMLLVWPLL
jgi:hypothetical protein